MSVLMDGKVCLVTGATSGIGQATALALAKMGAMVVIVGRNPQKGAMTTAMIKRESASETVDFLEPISHHNSLFVISFESISRNMIAYMCLSTTLARSMANVRPALTGLR